MKNKTYKIYKSWIRKNWCNLMSDLKRLAKNQTLLIKENQKKKPLKKIMRI